MAYAEIVGSISVFPGQLVHVWCDSTAEYAARFLVFHDDNEDVVEYG